MQSTDKEGRRISVLNPSLLDFSKFKSEEIILYNIYVMNRIMDDPAVRLENLEEFNNLEGANCRNINCSLNA